MSIQRFNPITFPRKPMNNITPFSYRDGYTYLELVENLRIYIGDEVLAELNKVIGEIQAYQDGVTDYVDSTVAAMVDNLNSIVLQVNDEVTRLTGEIDTEIQRFGTQYAQFVGEITGLVDSINNKTGSWGVQYIELTEDTVINVDPTWPKAHTVQFVVTQDATGYHSVSFGPGITDSLLTTIEQSPGKPTYFELFPDEWAKWSVRQPETINAGNFNIIPGSDNRELLNMLLSMKRKVVFPHKKEVTYDSSDGPLIINTSVDFNHSVLSDLQAENDGVRVIINDNVNIDKLHAKFKGCILFGGIQVRGSNVNIKEVIVESSDGNKIGADNYRRRPFNIGTVDRSAPLISQNVFVDSMILKNCEYGLGIWDAENVHVNNITMTGGKQGILIRDGRHVRVNGGTFEATSPDRVGRAGENAILIEASRYAFSSTDIVVTGFISKQSGEHGFRVGGQQRSSHVTFRDCRAENAGSVPSGEPHGACGFKTLGPTSAGPSAYHHHINFINCSVGTAATTGNGLNFSGFSIGKTRYCTLESPVVAPTIDDEKCVWYGIEIVGSQYVNINNPVIRHAEHSAVLIYGATDTPDITWGDTGNVVINGGMLASCQYGVRVAGNVDASYLRIILNGITTGNCLTGIYCDPGIVLFNRCWARARLIYTTNDPVISMDQWVMDLEYEGTESAMPCRNGSTRVNYMSGKREIRKSGVWVTV